MTGLKRTPRSRGGFTLVELIVVLVILGVLTAFAVPALTGYIDSAKEKQAVSETQACVMTATRQGAQGYRAMDDLQCQRAGFVLSVYQRRWDTSRIHGYRNECACGRKY